MADGDYAGERELGGHPPFQSTSFQRQRRPGSTPHGSAISYPPFKKKEKRTRTRHTTGRFFFKLTHHIIPSLLFSLPAGRGK